MVSKKWILVKLFILVCIFSKAQEREITGTVISGLSREPIPFVNIIIKGSQKGTTSNLEGKFKIKISSNDNILVFSFLGMITKEAKVGELSEINIEMEEDRIGLEDVVVIGYGTQKKSKVSSAISSVSSEDIKNQPVHGLDQAIQGRTTGVVATTNSASPGGEVNISIRGTGTINNSNPLYIVDGIPVGSSGMDFLNPEDIERIDILKDAAASAIYGTRGANGVILITTKKGNGVKEGNVVEFDMYHGIQSALHIPELTNAKDFAILRNKVDSTIGQAYSFTQEEIASLGEGTDWWKEVLRNAQISNYNLSISGSSAKNTYMISGSYFFQEGIVKNSDYNRLTLRVNTRTKILNDWLNIGENLTVGFINRNTLEENTEYGEALWNIYAMDPTVPVYNPNPDPALTAIYGEKGLKWSPAGYGSNVQNPVGIIERRNFYYKKMPLIGSVFLETEPIYHFQFNSSMGFEMTNGEQKNYEPVYYESVTNRRDVSFLNIKQLNWKNWEFYNTLTYTNAYKEHNFSALAGISASKSFFMLTDVVASDVPDNPDLWYIESGEDSTKYVFPNYPMRNGLLSHFGRVSYDYESKYLFQANLRHDGSSMFGPNYKWGWFPSFSLGWILTKESFMKKFPVINMLKLRAGWGELGNDKIDEFNYVSLIEYSIYDYSFNGNKVPGSSPKSLSNADLHWESTGTTDIGLDLALWENKIEFTFDYFIKKTSGLLVELPVPLIVGANQSSFMNAGDIRNKGFEFDLSYRKFEGKLNYTVGFNFSKVKNEVINLGKGVEPIPKENSGKFGNSIARIDVGYPIYSFYGYKTDGIFQNWEEVNSHCQPKAKPGDIRFKDLNGDGQITDDDITWIGNPHPDFVMGIHGSAQYKGFDFNTFIYCSYGNDILYAMKIYTESSSFYNFSPTMLDAWTPENTDTDIPRIDGNNANDNMRISDRYIVDGSYIRMKTIQAGYTLPDNLTKKVKVNKLRIYIGIQNLFTLTKYPGADPELGRTPQGGIGIDYGTYPHARTFMTGINMTL